MAFRDGDKGQMGQLGALIIADGINALQGILRAYVKVHS
jgi:hypothetical protein